MVQRQRYDWVANGRLGVQDFDRIEQFMNEI